MIVSGGVRFHPALKDLLVPINLVHPHPDNPNNGDSDAIAVSIEVNGMYRPVEIQASTGYILAGNTTYAACLELGATEIPVVWLDVDDETALRILLGDNQLARLARMDRALELPLLERLMDTDLQLLGTGYTVWDPPPEPEYGRSLSLWLTGDLLASWLDVPGETDRDRLEFLLTLR